MSFDTLSVRRQGAVLFAEIAAPPMNLLGPELVRDLPAGGKRLIQRAHGYRHTFLSGVEVLRDDRPTGALPGAVVRGAQAAPR